MKDEDLPLCGVSGFVSGVWSTSTASDCCWVDFKPSSVAVAMRPVDGLIVSNAWNKFAMW